MTDATTTQTGPVSVAIDLARLRHEILIAVTDRKGHRRLTVLHQLDGFNRLITKLTDYGRPVRVPFEAKGNYHRVLAYQIGISGVDVKLLSSVALARTREA